VDDTSVALGTISANGSTITVPLQAAWVSGVVKVIYAKPTDAQPGWTDTSSNQNQVANFTETATFAEQRAPELTGAAMGSNGTTLTLTFDETLAVTNPANLPSAFSVTVDGESKAVTYVQNDGANRVLTLASPAVLEGVTVTVSYTKPGSDGLRDAAGFEVASFTDQAVTNGSPTTTTTTPPTTTAPAPAPAPAPAATTTTTEPTTTTTEPVTVSTTPSLVTGENQAALSATAGAARVLVNGEEVALTLTSTGADDAGAAAPEERTAEQIVELQEAADGLVERLDTAAGGDSGLEVVDTDTGAEIDGLFDDTRVPVEDVIIAESTTFTGLYASRDEGGSPNPIRSEMLEMERGDEVAVFFYGLPAGESAELVLMSTPYLLGTATADAQGNFSRVLSAPEAILAGDHTLVTATDSLTVSLGIRITDPNVVRDEATALRLPATGGGAPVAPALFFTVLGSLLLIHSRRREVPGN